jgi:hypothetical protein
MKLGQTVGIVIGSLLAILVAITFILPDEVPQSRTETLCAPQETVFTHFNDLEKLSKWSSLVGAEALERQYEGTVGAGAQVRLLDDRDRWIAIEITDSRAPDAVDYHFSTHEDVNSRASVVLAATSANTDVTVRVVQEFRTLPGRWAIVFIRSAIDEFLREELGRLASVMDELGHACPVTEH